MGLKLEEKETWADGRDFLAGEAVNHGLVTSLVKTRNEAITNLL